MPIMNRRIGGACVLAAALPWSAFVHAAETVKIGFVMPFSGPAASYGVDARQAAEPAVKEINPTSKRKLELVLEDDKGTPQGAMSATQKQIAMNKMNAVVGGMGSQLALAQSAVTKNRVLYINTAAQGDAIMDQGHKWLFQISNTSSMNAEGFHQYIIGTLKPKTIVFGGGLPRLYRA